jgi:hypothetical protein
MPTTPASAQSARSFTGRFRARPERTALLLERTGGDLQLIFSAVERHNVPAFVENIVIDGGTRQGGSAKAQFDVLSAGKRYSVIARSLQTHEHVALYGKVISLPRFGLRQRLVWTLLLGLARFEWGQALIRRLTHPGPRTP